MVGFITFFTIFALGMVLKQDRKQHTLMTPDYCYIWHDGKLQCRHPD